MFLFWKRKKTEDADNLVKELHICIDMVNADAAHPVWTAELLKRAIDYIEKH